MKNYFLCFLLLVCFGACSQKSQSRTSNLTSKNYIETMLKTIKHYDYEPQYYLTYVQNSCYSEILINDIPLHKNFSEVADGETIKINNYIFKSGTQKVTFRLYPASKARELDFKTLKEETNMQIDISESDNVDRYKKGKQITKYLTPTITITDKYGNPITQFIATGKTYYEASFNFEAKVPFEYNSLEEGQDLRKWKPEKLEKKVVEFYKNQLTLLKDKKKDEYFSFLELVEKETRQSLYFNKKELQDILDSYLEAFTIPNYEMQPLENYTVKFYGDGRIVSLETKSLDNRLRGESALWAKYDEGDGEMADFFKYYLYIPEGEDELIILR